MVKNSLIQPSSIKYKEQIYFNGCFFFMEVQFFWRFKTNDAKIVKIISFEVVR